MQLPRRCKVNRTLGREVPSEEEGVFLFLNAEPWWQCYMSSHAIGHPYAVMSRSSDKQHNRLESEEAS